MQKSSKTICLCLAMLLCTALGFAQKVNEPKDVPAEWSKPYEPFRIVGNLYYVGTYDLACYLITAPKRHILINTGLANSADLIKANVEALGFKFSDIKILLTTQAHYDHLGAMAEIKKQTAAQFMVDERDAQVAADGGQSDYAFGDKGATFAPIKADRLLHNNDTIVLGGTQLVVLHHPGHTKGSCSYLCDVKDTKRSYRVLIANLPSIVTENHFDQIPTYPQIAQDYAYTFNAMAKLKFDIWLSSHASQFHLHEKHKPSDTYNPEKFRDLSGYRIALAELKMDFNKKSKQK
jgi:metallo-beta-lactamase class B